MSPISNADHPSTPTSYIGWRATLQVGSGSKARDVYVFRVAALAGEGQGRSLIWSLHSTLWNGWADGASEIAEALAASTPSGDAIDPVTVIERMPLSQIDQRGWLGWRLRSSNVERSLSGRSQQPPVQLDFRQQNDIGPFAMRHVGGLRLPDPELQVDSTILCAGDALHVITQMTTRLGIFPRRIGTSDLATPIRALGLHDLRNQAVSHAPSPAPNPRPRAPRENPVLDTGNAGHRKEGKRSSARESEPAPEHASPANDGQLRFAWQSLYYQGRSRFEKQLQAIQCHTRDRIRLHMDRAARNLRAAHAYKMADKDVYELRVQLGEQDFRVVFAIDGANLVALGLIPKGSRGAQTHELETTDRQWKQFCEERKLAIKVAAACMARWTLADCQPMPVAGSVALPGDGSVLG